MTERRGDWIQTFTGKAFWPMDPRPEDIDIEDIAHALAMKCRFSGHCLEFYSVAQHSVLVSRSCPEAPLWALLHDAAEAYLPDVARPVKRFLTGFKEIEERVERCVAERFGLPWPMPESVKRADLEALATEQRDVMGTAPMSWGSLLGVRTWDRKIEPTRPVPAKVLFLSEFKRLTR